MSKPWHDKETLERLYVDEHLSQREIASRLDTTQPTIGKWLKRHDIQSRTRGGKEKTGYHDKDILKELYEEQKFSTHQISEKFDVSHATILNWLEKFNIERRDRTKLHPNFRTDWNGYERAEDSGKTVYIHRLAAVAWFGYDEVVENIVSFENGFRMDIRESNLSVVSESEHGERTIGEMFPMRGRSHSEEAKRKISEARSGQKLGANTKECVRCGDEFEISPNKEDSVYQCSDCVEEYGFHERRNQKISETKTGVARSEEAKEKMSKSHMGKELSDEHRANIGKANKGEKNNMYGRTGEDHPGYGNEGWQETEWGEVEETGHFVKSSWEAEVDKLLHEAGVDYGYEEERFKFKELTYTPDFTTENVIIEVKGYPRPRAERQAELLMEHDARIFIVVGNRESPDAAIPCDHHISYADRNDLLALL